MDRMQSIAPTERRRLAPLFTDHRHLRPNVDAVLQGYCGTAIANTGSDLRVAQLTLSVLTFLGGDPTHPVARHVAEQLSGGDNYPGSFGGMERVGPPRPWPQNHFPATGCLLCQVPGAYASAAVHRRGPSGVSGHPD